MLINKFLTASILIQLFFIAVQHCYPQNNSYKTFTQNQLHELIPSQTRYIASLSGRWERSYDEKEWDYVRLPFSNPGEKRITYKRTLKIDDELVDQYTWQLYFLGVSDQVEIYFNDQFVGRCFGGLTPFTVRIPGRMISGGSNTIKLVVSPKNNTARLIQTQNLYPKKLYMGIIRELLLIGTPHIWISDLNHKVYFKPKQSKCIVRATVNISSDQIEKIFKYGSLADSLSSPGSEKVSVRIESLLRKKSSKEILARGQSKVISIGRERSVAEEISLGINSPELWSAQNPALYELVVKITKNGLLIDDLSIDIGFRDISIISEGKNRGIYVNGSFFRIKGVSYIEDYYGTAHTLSTGRMEKDILQMKTLGANVVRFKYSAPHPYFAKLCDKYGLFLLIELPIYEVPATLLSLDEIKVRMKNITRRYLNAYINHPSVLAWGITDGVEEGAIEAREFSSSIIKLFRQSSNKLIYKTVLFGAKNLDMINYDFVGFRDAKEKYKLADFKKSIMRLQSLAKGKPVFIVYGIPIQPDNHNGFSDPLSLESQAYYIRNSFHIVNDLDCAGSIINSYNDFELSNPFLIVNNKDQFDCTSGLVDRKREQRPSFNTLQTLFNNEKEPLLNAGSYTEETPVIFIIAGIALGIILVLLINRFRRFREYLFRAVLRPYNFYADIRDQRIMSPIQTLLLGIIISITIGIFLSSICYFYRTNIIAQYCYMLILPYSYIKEIFFRIIWIPELLLVTVSVVFFILSIISATIIRVFAIFIRARIFFRDTFTITVWSSVPVLILLPISIILIRLLNFSDILTWVIAPLLLLILIWALFRTMRATAVVYDIPKIKVYFVGLILAVFSAGIILSVYQYQLSIFQYSQYLFDVLLKY